MRQKELHLIVTFDTTADAIAMEQVCESCGIQGRLIPVPTVVSAGCGLAWCADVAQEEQLKALIAERALHTHELLLCVL